MKKKIILILTVLTILFTTVFAFVGCSSKSERVDDAELAAYNEYKAEILDEVKSCEEQLEKLLSRFSEGTYELEFTYERYYLSNSGKDIYRGSESTAGERGDWYVIPAEYKVLSNGKDIYIEAKQYEPILKDDYKAKKIQGKSVVYKYLLKDGVQTTSQQEISDNIKNITYDIVFGELKTFTDKAFLETHITSADSGFRLYTSMMQMQTTQAFDYSLNELKYEDSKGKLRPSLAQSSLNKTTNKVEYKINGNVVNMAGDDVAYWDGFGEDLIFNFHKVSVVFNKKLVLTYNKSKSRLDTVEVYEEMVEPYYAKKDDFNSFNTVKARVSQYNHYVYTIKYVDSVSIPSNL